MKIFVISSLLGDYSKVAEEVEEEVKRSVRFSGETDNRLQHLEEDNRLLKEELNELYLKYDRLCAAFGEMNHLVVETAAVATRFAGEEEK